MHYKQEHFRLRTGLSTVFPCSKISYDKIIATVPPKNFSTKLIQKAIVTTLDAVVDHRFKSTIIPTFEIDGVDDQCYKILLSTLISYIDENTAEMASKKIIICVNNYAEERLAKHEAMEGYGKELEGWKDLGDIGDRYPKEETKEQPKNDDWRNKRGERQDEYEGREHSELVRRIDQLEEELKEVTTDRDLHEDKSKERKGRIDELRKEINPLKSLNQTLQTKIDDLTRKNTRLQSLNEDSKKQVNSFNTIRSQKEQKISAEIETLKKDKQGLIQSLGDQQKALEKFNLKDMQSQQKIVGLEEQIVQLNNKIEEMDRENQEIIQKASQDEENFNDCTKELLDRNQELSQKVGNLEYGREQMLTEINKLTQDYNIKVEELKFAKGMNRRLGSSFHTQNHQQLAEIETALESKTIELSKVLEENNKLSQDVEFWKQEDVKLRTSIEEHRKSIEEKEHNLQVYQVEMQKLKDEIARNKEVNHNSYNREDFDQKSQDIIKKLEEERDSLITDYDECLKENKELKALHYPRKNWKTEESEDSKMINKQIIKECNAKYERLVDESHRLEEENAKLLQDIESFKEKVQECEEMIKELTNEDDLKGRLSKAKKGNNQLRKDIENITREHAEMKDKHLNSLEKYSDIQEKFVKLEEKYRKLENKNKKLKESCVPLDEFNDLAEKYNLLNQKKKALKNKLASKHESDDEEEKSDKGAQTLKGEKLSKRKKAKNMRSMIESEAVEVDINNYEFDYSSDDTRNIGGEDEQLADAASVISQSVKVGGIPKTPRVVKSKKGARKPKVPRRAKKKEDKS